MLIALLTGAALLLWSGILLSPWRPWRADIVFCADAADQCEALADVTALMPARNEALVLAQSIGALKGQSQALNVVVVDDQSTDDTARIAHAAGAIVINGEPVPAGWSGKLWALEQGRAHLRTEYVLLIDADIALAPGTLATLRARMRRNRIAFASLVPRPRFQSFWEKLMMPAFIYFFALLYPFRLSNSPRS